MIESIGCVTFILNGILSEKRGIPFYVELHHKKDAKRRISAA